MSPASNVNSEEVKRDFEFTPTQDWFSGHIDTWMALFPLVDSTAPRILEIGSWEGRSAVFLLQELCRDDGEIICIDHFDLMHTPAGRDRYAKTHHNLSLTGKKFRIMDEFSVPALMTLLEEELSSANPGFHWIYVDGSHEAADTFLDGELVWRLDHPKRGIDSFMKLHEGEYERLSSPAHYQVILKKITDMRVGFVVKNKPDDCFIQALGYGINIVLTVDSRYAAAAAVTLRSAVNNTQRRITVYVVDCGLQEGEKQRIRLSVPNRNDVTLMFLPLPKNGFAQKMGVVWAKLDIIKTVPVEKVLYLDADILVRASLEGLWDADLQELEIGAAVDVGFPMGHDDITKGPYFNAGVMVMDLAKVRKRTHDLEQLAWNMKESRFRDQDALNVHFAGNWTCFDLTWNAQGLGTYAVLPSANRQSLALENMNNPNIVHFNHTPQSHGGTPGHRTILTKKNGGRYLKEQHGWD